MTQNPRSATCQSCDADVIFVPSAKTGRPMILDAKPAKRVIVGAFSEFEEGDEPHGDILINGYLLGQSFGVMARAHVVDVYTDHHATCPDSAAWKGRHRGEPDRRQTA